MFGLIQWSPIFDGDLLTTADGKKIKMRNRNLDGRCKGSPIDGLKQEAIVGGIEY